MRGGIVEWVDPNPPPEPEPPPPPIVPLATVIMRLMVADKLNDVLAVLAQNEPAKTRLVAVLEGIYPDDVDARALLTAAGAEPDEILALPEE